MPGREIDLEGKWLLLGEGGADSHFLNSLVAARAIPNCLAVSPGALIDGAGGKDRFPDFLLALKLQRTFPAMLGVVVVSDNDDDPINRFMDTARAISDAGHFATPSKPEEIASSAALKSSAVVMLPAAGVPGALEDLVLAIAARECPDLLKCVDDAVKCGGLNAWAAVKQSKARVQSLIALRCKSDPNTSLAYLWNRPEKFSLMGVELDPLASFLRALPA